MRSVYPAVKSTDAASPMPRPKASRMAVTMPGSIWRVTTLQHHFEFGGTQRKRGMFQVGRHAADDFVHGAGHDREFDQRQDDDACQQGGAQTEGDHQREAECAVDDGWDAPQHIQREADITVPILNRRDML